MSGIQVNPSRTSDLAMQTFGENYTQIVVQLAEARAFGEAAQNRVLELETMIAKREEELNDAKGLSQRLMVENDELRTSITELQSAAEHPHS